LTYLEFIVNFTKIVLFGTLDWFDCNVNSTDLVRLAHILLQMTYFGAIVVFD